MGLREDEVTEEKLDRRYRIKNYRRKPSYDTNKARDKIKAEEEEIGGEFLQVEPESGIKVLDSWRRVGEEGGSKNVEVKMRDVAVNTSEAEERYVEADNRPTSSVTVTRCGET